MFSFDRIEKMADQYGLRIRRRFVFENPPDNLLLLQPAPCEEMDVGITINKNGTFTVTTVTDEAGELHYRTHKTIEAAMRNALRVYNKARWPITVKPARPPRIARATA